MRRGTWLRLSAAAWLTACFIASAGLSACGDGNQAAGAGDTRDATDTWTDSVEAPEGGDLPEIVEVADNEGSEPDAPSTAVIVGPEGGTVTGPDGVQIVVPAGALGQPTSLSITRSSLGAPALPADNVPGPIYEFLPHGLVFDAPVTLRLPVPDGATGSTVFVAGPGEDWQEGDATAGDGFAEWQRNSFSWGTFGGNCQPVNRSPYSASNPDPYPCAYPRGSASASASPATALTPVPNPIPTYFSPVADNPVSWVVNQATTVQLTLRYAAAPDCQNPRLKLLRWDPAAPLSTPDRVTTLYDQPVVLTPTTYSVVPGAPGLGTYVRGSGSTTLAVAFTHLDNLTLGTNGHQGTHAFGVSFSCNRPFREVRTGGEVLTFVSKIPDPGATYTVGGAVTGLTGTGLVLQNNGGDDLEVPGDGPFTFSAAIAAGATYAVSVQSQPSDQACTVLHGNGTAQANVTDVAVTCGSVSPVEPSDLISDAVVEGAPVVAFVGGAPMVLYKEGVTNSVGEHISASRYLEGAWTTPVELGSGSAAYGFDFIKLAPSADGSALALWHDYGELFAARFDGVQWSAAVRVDTAAPQVEAGGGDDYRLAVDAYGKGLAVWHSGALQGPVTLVASTYEAGAWSAPVQVAPDVEPFTLSDLAMDSQGRATLAWRDLSPYGMVVARHAWSTGFSAPTFFGGTNYPPVVAVDDAGNSMVFWSTTDLAGFPLVSRRFDGSAWSAMMTFADESAPNVAGLAGLAMASAAQGGLSFVTYTVVDQVALTQEVWTRRALGAGAWETPLRLSAPAQLARSMGLATNASARAVASFGPITTDLYYLSELRNAVHTGADGAWTGADGGTLVASSAELGIIETAPPAISDSGTIVNVWLECIQRTTGSPCAKSELRGLVTPP